MPQCSKCGKEITDYGLCEKCKLVAQKKVNQVKVRKTVKCPICQSLYVKTVGINLYRCSNCDCEFSIE